MHAIDCNAFNTLYSALLFRYTALISELQLFGMAFSNPKTAWFERGDKEIKYFHTSASWCKYATLSHIVILKHCQLHFIRMLAQALARTYHYIAYNNYVILGFQLTTSRKKKKNNRCYPVNFSVWLGLLRLTHLYDIFSYEAFHTNFPHTQRFRLILLNATQRTP